MKKLLLIFLGVILAIMGFLMLPWIAIGLHIYLSPDPPMPEITYGEFPFRLVYELNGEQIVIEDIIICEYDGVGMNEGVGKYRKWKRYLASNGDESLLLVSDGTRKIYCSTGSANYYMNDEKYPIERPFIPRVYMDQTDNTDVAIFTQGELLDKYNIKLISWEFSEPIINNFISQ